MTREFDLSDFSFHKVKGTGFYYQFIREASLLGCQPVSLQSSMIMPNIFPIGLYSSLFVPYFSGISPSSHARSFIRRCTLCTDVSKQRLT
eukprot:UN22168